MSLERLVREGWFTEDPYEYSLDQSKLTAKEKLALTLNGKTRIASLEDSRIYDLTVKILNGESYIQVESLPVHTKQTAAMAGYSETQFLKLFAVESVFTSSLIKRTLKPPKKPWWKFWS